MNSEELIMKLGIVGNGGIVVSALESLKNTDIEVKALWCRNAEKGRPLTEKYGIPALYDNYAEFLENREFDTVYIGLINSLHYEYARGALQAGKHVICEKPLTVTLQEAKELAMIAMDREVMLFEAIMSRYSANFEALRTQVRKAGDIRLILSDYSQYSRRYDAYLEGKVLPAFDPKLAGGALMDINVYNIHLVTGLFGKPDSVQYYPNTGFNGVDTSGILILDYGTFKAVCTGAKDCSGHSGTQIQGTEGYISIDSRPGHVRNVTFVPRTGEAEKLDGTEEPNPMETEFRKIRDVIDAGDVHTARLWIQQSLTIMSVIEQARKSTGTLSEITQK